MKHTVYNFCTLFDSYYLPKGLILYDSLCEVCDNFQLYVFAFDEPCHRTLATLQLPHMTVISLQDFETEELLAAKATRTRAEYCWTCGASTIWHAIRHFNLDHCTYVDADLMFFNSPKVAYDEIEKANASIALTEHFTNAKTEDLAGRFCVQFTYFKNDKDGMQALQWWKDACIEWCYARYEDGKFGDQKYLDYFPERFDNVHVIEHRGVGVAPWNMRQYSYLGRDQLEFNGAVYPIVFFHYHGVRVEVENNILVLQPVTGDIPKAIETIFFVPFLERYKVVCKKYLNVTIKGWKINKRKWHIRMFYLLKRVLKNSKFVRYLYYKVVKKGHSGHEKIAWTVQ